MFLVVEETTVVPPFSTYMQMTTEAISAAGKQPPRKNANCMLFHLYSAHWLKLKTAKADSGTKQNLAYSGLFRFLNSTSLLAGRGRNSL